MKLQNIILHQNYIPPPPLHSSQWLNWLSHILQGVQSLMQRVSHSPSKTIANIERMRGGGIDYENNGRESFYGSNNLRFWWFYIVLLFAKLMGHHFCKVHITCANCRETRQNSETKENILLQKKFKWFFLEFCVDLYIKRILCNDLL